MTAEWIQVDCDLDRKPEMLIVAEQTEEEVGTIVGRMVMFWSWAAMNTVDGTTPLTITLMCKIFGGSKDFWLAVERAGWLQVNTRNGTVTIPNFQKRFSQSAKRRALHRRRAEASRCNKITECAPAHGDAAPKRTGDVGPSAQEEKRGKERRSSTSTTAGGCAEGGEGIPAEDRWPVLRDAWNRGPGSPWKTSKPPDGISERLEEPGWFEEALQAIERLRTARYFDKSPVTLIQFASQGFVRRTNGGQYDNPKPAKGANGHRSDEKAPVREFTGKTAEAFKRTVEAWAMKAKALDSQTDRVMPPGNSPTPRSQRRMQSRCGRDGDKEESGT